MTLFTEGRLQSYERMMQDTGRYHRRDADEKHRTDKAKPKPKKPKTGQKAGDGHAGIPG